MTLDEFIEDMEESIEHNNDPIKDERFQKELACLRGVRDELQGLLAVIHRDGGHYEGQHGFEKAYKDAVEKVLTAYHAVDDLKKEGSAESSSPPSDLLDFLEGRLKAIDGSIAVEKLSGNVVKEAHEQGARAEIVALQCEIGNGRVKI